MRALIDTDVLRLWETGRLLTPLGRAQALLAAAHPDEADVLAALPVGTCTARLLAARAATMGDALPCQAGCPACGEKVEFALSTRVLLESAGAPSTHVHVPHGEETYTARLPTLTDLQAMVDEQGDARDLLERCAVSPPFSEWPDSVAAEAEALMAEADALAVISLTLACPACGHTWNEPLDATGFFFSELAVRARHALHDVHRLAQAYGWREADVLALSPWRRQQYLALVGA